MTGGRWAQTRGSILGNSVLRKEDPSLLMGAEEFYDDMKVPGMGYVHFALSPAAHAKINTIDISDAEAMPGVIGIWTSDGLELGDHLGFPLFAPVFARPPLARGRVRFVGDIIAVVAADSPAAAADAAEAVWMDFEPLPAVVDPVSALKPDSTLLFEEHGSNVCFETSIGLDDDDPLENASHITELTMVSQRLAGVPIEPNGILAIPDADRLTCWIPSQNPIAVRDALTHALGLGADAVRVAAPAGVGGGFGSKAGLYVEHIVTAALARDLGRPLKWTEERRHNMVSMLQGRGTTLTGKMGFDEDGVLVGLDMSVVADAGAYPAFGGYLTVFTQLMAQGPYKIPSIRFSSRSVVTNTTPTGAYRGAGRPEATQLLERLMDIAAHEIGIDPVDIRRRNFLRPNEFPLTALSGANYDTGDYETALDAALDAFGYQDLLVEQAERRASGSPRQLGVGVSAYVEVTAPGGLHVEYGAVEVHDDGTVTGRVGTSAHGQGHITAFSMIISDVLGVDLEDVTIVQSDTAEIPRGHGTMGSRSLQTAGSAIHVASETVLNKAKDLAAHLLEASPEDIVTGARGLHVAGVGARAISWGDLAVASSDSSQRPEGIGPGLAHELEFDGTDGTYPFGAHVSLVEVDMETGAVELLRHVALDDCGIILNPLLVTGQQHGGIAQGAAQALFESILYDAAGNPLTATLMDYAVPSAAELPRFETHNTETASPRNPLGAKGIGESSTIGSTPAIHNAVVNAVSHLGVRHVEMPLSPQSVWRAISYR